MIALKSGVRVRGLRPEILLGLLTVHDVLSKFHFDTVVTSALDGQHAEHSFHYNGLAVDVRSKHVEPASLSLIESEIKGALSVQYYFALEARGLTNEHFHLEFDDGSERPRHASDRL